MPTPSINKHVRHLHAVFEYASERRWIDYNPVTCRALPTSPRKVVLSVEEVQRVMGELTLPPRDALGVLTSPSPNWSLMIRLAIFTGMRQGEILGLQWHDLHASKAALYVTRTWKDGGYSPPKTENGYRWVEVPIALMGELADRATQHRRIGRRARPDLPDERGQAALARERPAARVVSGAEARGHLRLGDEGRQSRSLP